MHKPCPNKQNVDDFFHGDRQTRRRGNSKANIAC